MRRCFLRLQLKRVFKYLDRDGTVPFHFGPPVLLNSFDDVTKRGFFITSKHVDSSVAFWCLYLSSTRGVFEHYSRMKKELNYCIGARDEVLSLEEDFCLTTAEHMLVRAICKAVENNALKEINREPLTRFASQWDR